MTRYLKILLLLTFTGMATYVVAHPGHDHTSDSATAIHISAFVAPLVVLAIAAWLFNARRVRAKNKTKQG